MMLTRYTPTSVEANSQCACPSAPDVVPAPSTKCRWLVSMATSGSPRKTSSSERLHDPRNSDLIRYPLEELIRTQLLLMGQEWRDDVMASTLAAQYLNSGIFPIGSRAGFVSAFAAASA